MENEPIKYLNATLCVCVNYHYVKFNLIKFKHDLLFVEKPVECADLFIKANNKKNK